MNDSLALSPKQEEIRNTPNGNLWRGHAATPRQQRLVPSLKKGRKTQADVLIELLRRARAEGRPLTLPEIMAAGIAQHGARMAEIRERNFVVVNRMDRDTDGSVHSMYLLLHDPAEDTQ